MDEYISLQAVLDIASQYCPDDDGSCSKADVDLREMLDEIEALPVAGVQPNSYVNAIYAELAELYGSPCSNFSHQDEYML